MQLLFLSALTVIILGACGTDSNDLFTSGYYASKSGSRIFTDSIIVGALVCPAILHFRLLQSALLERAGRRRLFFDSFLVFLR